MKPIIPVKLNLGQAFIGSPYFQNVPVVMRLFPNLVRVYGFFFATNVGRDYREQLAPFHGTAATEQFEGIFFLFFFPLFSPNPYRFEHGPEPALVAGFFLFHEIGTQEQTRQNYIVDFEIFFVGYLFRPSVREKVAVTNHGFQVMSELVAVE